MKKLEIAANQRQLIESVIKEHPKYSQVSDMLDFLCEVIYRKSYLLIDTIKDEQRLKRHLAMVCDSCIDEIIKKHRPELNNVAKKDVKDEIVSIKKNSVSDERKKPINENVKSERFSKERNLTYEKNSPLSTLIDPIKVFPQKLENEEILDDLIKTVKVLDAKFPNKEFYKMFYMRYIEHFSQSEIAREMRISQAELSKRLVELVGLVKEN